MMAQTDYSGFIHPEKDGRHMLWLAIEGMSCAGCAFKIEKALNVDQDVEARVNVTDKRLRLVWSGDKSAGSHLIGKAEKLGFRFSPITQNTTMAEDGYLRSLMRCIAVSGFASGNIMMFSLALWFTTRDSMGASTRDLLHWYSALIALPSVVYAGMPFFRSAWGVLKRGHTNMDVPITIAVILSSAMSLFETIRGGEYVYFDSAIMLLFLLLVGRYFDAKARGHARAAAADLLSLMSGNATVIDADGKKRQIPAADLKPGMVIQAAMGEKFLADGVLLDDVATIDASAITGETLPQVLVAGGMILAGMVNTGQPVHLRASKAQEETVMSDIIRLMQKAEQGNAAYVRIADRIASWYTPAVHALALITFLGWFGYAGIAWQQALLYAITVLIITCPCALGLAVPVVQVIASHRLFRQGMLLKSADALERLAAVDTIIFDKTGTLTTGKIVFENQGDFTNDELRLVSSMASNSRHPLACAVAAVADGDLSLKVDEIIGKGLATVYQGNVVKLGSASYIGISTQTQDSHLELWFQQGVSDAKRLIFTDHLHADALEICNKLSKRYRLMLLSGDRYPVAANIAAQLGLQSFQADVNPAQKLDIVSVEKSKGHQVLMVGDGLNDAPALTSASVSMSPSSALDIAQNAADLVYQSKGISSILYALDTARRSQRLVQQNFMMAFGYNVIAIPLAMAGFVTPLTAAIAMSSSSLLVIANALRLRGK